jgi:cysteinyl-tRNA synthetase
MDKNLFIYNTLRREKVKFEPNDNKGKNVGMYVCGPTVYSETHLGHARPAITFDLLFRYLKHLGYKVRYVRNITDVGHLENDADEGEDKIEKKARLEQLEPMEVAQKYINDYHKYMKLLNVEPPSIEPRASGHIIEQQALIEKILNNGFAYESNGSVYFDVEKYSMSNTYGELSGRVIEELKENTRKLKGKKEKKNNNDFALWKKATPEHIMRWKKTFKYKNGKYANGDTKYIQFTSDGFPGWHLECSAMSVKYLGDKFDIHGGGMDLMFPHHECEIAQNVAASGHDAVKYWMHNNMITINGQKMARSLNNFITLKELFTHEQKLLEQIYSPMTVRFFILQAHYRSTLDFSNEALQAAGKGLQRLMTALKTLENLKPSDKSTIDVIDLEKKCYEAINDDLNSAILISHLMDGVRMINSVKDGNDKISKPDLEKLISIYKTFVEEILGLKDESDTGNNKELIGGLIKLLNDIRLKAKTTKDFTTSDQIRNELAKLGVEIKDTKEGFDWSIK